MPFLTLLSDDNEIKQLNSCRSIFCRIAYTCFLYSEIKLNVSMDSPQIIIPASSTSADLVVADLGHLTVKNTFKNAEYAELDVIHVTLTNTCILLHTKFSRKSA